MRRTVQRASGTLTFGDVVRRAVRLNRRTPDVDIADLLAGRPLSVTAWRAEGEERGWSRGELLFELGTVRWAGRERTGRRLRSVDLALAPPFSVLGATPLDRNAPVDRHDFVRFELTAGQFDWVLAVPRRDIELIREALRQVERHLPER